MSNSEIEPCVIEARIDALHGDTGGGGESSRQQPINASIAVGNSGGGACRPNVAAINDDGEQQDDGELSDSTHGDVRTEKPPRYPYAAMFFTMTAVVGQR